MTMLLIENNKFKFEISKRVEIGEELFGRNINTNELLDKFNLDFKIWNEFNFEYLKQAFDKAENEYKEAYNNAGFSFMGQVGVVPNNPVLSLKTLIKYKIDNLKSLVSKSELLKTKVAPNDKFLNAKESNKTQIFIVHGHDGEAKNRTARFIEKLGFIPIILHEQSSSGNTIIEKIEEYSNVGFGIILYTPCDVGAKKSELGNLKPRARQNVVFEHGYLIGKIGRKNVCALLKSDVEIPNDISGVVFVTMDTDDAWQLKVAKELRSAGYDVDLNKL